MKMLHDVYGLSCVENQILFLLSEHGQPIEHLYFDSAIPLVSLYNYMVLGDISFYNFNLIEKIQDVLKRLRIIDMKKVNLLPSDVLNFVRRVDNQECLIRVNKEFVTKKLSTRNFREDHFVRLKNDGDFYRVINDIPYLEVPISAEELYDFYDGEMFIVRYIRDINKEDKMYLYESRRFKVEDLTLSTFSTNKVNSRVVDLIVVYQTLVQRMRLYYKKLYNVEISILDVDAIDKLKSISQYYYLRNNLRELSGVLDSLLVIEQKIWRDIIGEVKGKSFSYIK